MTGLMIQKTGETAVVAASDGRVTLSVPIRIKRRSGRKLVTLPNGDAMKPRAWTPRPHRCSWRWLAATAGWQCWSRAR